MIDIDPIKLTLAAARVNAGLTQQEVAEKLHISARQLIKWERGDVVPKELAIRGLASLYGVPRDAISMPK